MATKLITVLWRLDGYWLLLKLVLSNGNEPATYRTAWPGSGANKLGEHIFTGLGRAIMVIVLRS